MKQKSSKNKLTYWAVKSIRFLKEDLWVLDLGRLNNIKKALLKSLQVLYLVAEGFIKDKLLLRASALTYWTLLSIVPLFAFMFSLLKGLGVQKRIESILLERVAVGSQEIVSQITGYIDRVNVGSLGTVGLIILLLTVISVLSNVEATFNDIWGIKIQRSYLRKFTDYLSLLIIFPVAIFTVVSITASMKSTAIVTWLIRQPGLGPFMIFLIKCLPYIMLWMLFTFLFLFMPNTKVKLIPAGIAGIFTGTCWQVAQWGYVTFQVGVTKYNAIYGTFAQLPIMMIWIYISWVIVLFGSEFAFALQNVAIYRKEQESDVVNIESRMELAVAFIRDIQDAFATGGQPWQDTTLAEKEEVSIRLARSVLAWLKEAGLIISADQDNVSYVLPAQDLGELKVHQLLGKLEKTGPYLTEKTSGLRGKEKALLSRLKKAREETFGNLKLRDT